MPPRFKVSCCLASLAAVALAAPSVFGTSIGGDEEVVESTPTPRQSTIRPTPTPEPESVDDPVPRTQTKLPQLPTPAPETAVPSPKTAARGTKPSVNEAFGAALQAAETSYRARDYQNALKALDKAEEVLPGDINTLNIRGAVYAATADYEQASMLYKQALKKEPESFWPRYNLAEIFFIQKKYPEARQAFTDMFSKFPGNELLQFKVFLTYLEEKNEAEAKAALDKIPFLSSTPAYSFSWAAWEFRHGNQKGSEGWIKSGRRIFGPEKTSFYEESLSDLKIMPPAEPTSMPTNTPPSTPTE